MRTSVVFLILLLLTCPLYADNINGRSTVIAKAFNAAVGGDAIVAATPMTCSASADTFTAIKSIKYCEFQGVDITCGGLNTVTATMVVQYSLSDGTDGGAITWRDTTAVAITEAYAAAVTLYLPPCKLLRIKFTADSDGTAGTYTIVHAVLTRY